MPWIAFERDFLWSPPAMNNRVSIQFKQGSVFYVTRAAAEKAIGRGAGRKATSQEIEHARGGVAEGEPAIPEAGAGG